MHACAIALHATGTALETKLDPTLHLVNLGAWQLPAWGGSVFQHACPFYCCSWPLPCSQGLSWCRDCRLGELPDSGRAAPCKYTHRLEPCSTLIWCYMHTINSNQQEPRPFGASTWPEAMQTHSPSKPG